MNDMLPRLVVFDLDFTLWDCGGTWCDCLSPPFHTCESQILDSDGQQVRLYDDALAILDRCDDRKIPMALASRTQQPTWARELVERLGVATEDALLVSVLSSAPRGQL
ncbi:MAG: magnesium-dependent phosphatase-1 [Rhodopirellula sp. JB055]|uniref:magnesium-dependent phosphatase-1 n=1 Tax=Rhodopirellula sp. JB055 TaxID=3342846 RepID=UPI00370C2B9B